jgi:hypothetical protein
VFLVQTTRNAYLQAFLRSPLTDSNRRPPPYHGEEGVCLCGIPRNHDGLRPSRVVTNRRALRSRAPSVHPRFGLWTGRSAQAWEVAGSSPVRSTMVRRGQAAHRSKDTTNVVGRGNRTGLGAPETGGLTGLAVEALLLLDGAVCGGDGLEPFIRNRLTALD